MDFDQPQAAAIARITTLADWVRFFHPTNGIFRSPSDDGEHIRHLDIDLRFIQPESGSLVPAAAAAPVHLPNLTHLTLRGGGLDGVDHPDRMACLSEVLLAVDPIEVRWLNGSNDPDERLSVSTHFVNALIVEAGEEWAARGTLRKLVVRGGFPALDPTAPATLARLTHRGSVDSDAPSEEDASIPSLPATPTLPSMQTLSAKNSRESLRKPINLDFAFGSWAVKDLEWHFDGGYTRSAILMTLQNLFRAYGASFPYGAPNTRAKLPVVVTLISIPAALIDSVRVIPDSLKMSEAARSWMHDVTFLAEDDAAARLCDEEPTSNERMFARLRANLIVAQAFRHVHLDQLHPEPQAQMEQVIGPVILKLSPERFPKPAEPTPTKLEGIPAQY